MRGHSAPQPIFSREVRPDHPYPLITSSSKPFCPLSRYRPELRTCSAIGRIRPVDGQRLPSAYPAVFTAVPKEDWLPLPFTDPPAISEYRLIHKSQSWKMSFSPFRYMGQCSVLYTPCRASLETGVWSSRKDRLLIIPIVLLQAPPCGIPGYSLLSGGRLFTGGRNCALVRVPPAQHCIFCLSTFRCRFTPVPQGTGAGYPRRFSPMRAFRQLPLPKADASQNGFHPALALSCRMAWRNSL